MALIRWNPTGELLNLHSELDRVFTDLTQEMLRGMGPARHGNGAHAYLPVDIRRTEDALEIEASVPGFKPEEVEVTFDGGVLTIDAQRSEDKEQKEKDFVRKERYEGRLFRQVALGDGFDSDSIKASFESGVLRITVPQSHKAEPKRIPVSASQEK